MFVPVEHAISNCWIKQLYIYFFSEINPCFIRASFNFYIIKWDYLIINYTSPITIIDGVSKGVKHNNNNIKKYILKNLLPVLY